MVHENTSKGNEHKPRGRPTSKGGKRGRPKKHLLAPSGREVSGDGGVIAPSDKLSPVMPEIEKISLNESLTKILDDIAKDTVTKEEIDNPMSDKENEETKDLELIESIEFENGKNVLSIRFSKKHNRMFRIQIYLNNEHEIRPVTYTGAHTGYSFWNFLKGALKK